MKGLVAPVAGGVGLGAFLRRRGRPALSPSPAEGLRAKLESSKGLETDETPVDDVSDVDARRADVQARARAAIDELGES